MDSKITRYLKLECIDFKQLGFKMGRAVGDGLRTYYKGKIEELELLIKDKGHNLRRLEAQRNELNASGDWIEQTL